jgi:hypothetical protein
MPSTFACDEIIAAIETITEGARYFHSQELRRLQPYCTTSIPTL